MPSWQQEECLLNDSFRMSLTPGVPMDLRALRVYRTGCSNASTTTSLQIRTSQEQGQGGNPWHLALPQLSSHAI
jgi:hypothetical protein